MTGNQDTTSTLFLLGAQRLIRELLEQEATDFLGREHCERCQETNRQTGLRNAYKQRFVKTTEGKIPVHLP
ncbi:MAG TPA: hypothetical protein DCE07_02990 [Peptococcaceae bacterium]|nr:hypothetical protein [Peptococcaceae bacterium]